MKKLICIIGICLNNFNLFSQIIWHETPNVTEIGDTTYYRLNTKYFYDYFYQKYDSVMIDIDFIQKGMAEPITQICSVNNKTGKGIILIQYNNQTFTKYEIDSNNVRGLGVVYASLNGNSKKIPFQQAHFNNSKLNGFFTYLDWKSGIIKTILYYKNGVFDKIIYTDDNNDNWLKTHKYPDFH